MADEEITTLKRLRSAIREAKEVYVQPRFGSSERWSRVSKTEVMALIKGMTDAHTPQFYEMPTGLYGTLEADGSLYVG